MPSLPVPCRLFMLALLAAAPAAAQQKQTGDVPYVPTPEAVVEAMLQLAEVGPKDRLLDLGSGDGRIVVTAAQKHGASGIGVDINPVRIREANQNAQAAGVADKVQFIQGNLFDADLSRADVLTLYLLPQINLELRPKILAQMKPGARVVSHDFDMDKWAPDRRIEVPGDGSPVYLWVVPARVAGVWRLDTGDGAEPWRLEIGQEFQTISGTARRGSETVDLGQGVLAGDQVTFEWPDGRRFVGRVAPDSRRMVGLTEGEGQVAQSGDWQAVREGS